MLDLSSAYDRLKSYYGRMAAGLHPAVTLPPLRVTFEVTYRCNLACSFCFQEVARTAAPQFRKEYELSNGELLQAIEPLPRTSLITLNGGEVFVRRDLPELLRDLTQRGRRFNLVTNGTMLFADKAQLLVEEATPLSVGFSIDGIGDLHDRIRRLPGAYQRTVENLKGLVEHRRTKRKKLPLVDMKTVITPENAGQLADLYGLAREIGSDYYTLSCLRTSGLILSLPCRSALDGGLDEYPPPLPGPMELDVLKAQLDRLFVLAAQGGPRLRFYPSYASAEGILKYYANQADLSDYHPCKAPWTNIRVAPNGDVYPCLAYRMGNIRERGLMEIWHGAALDQFRQRLRGGLVPACLGCCFLRARKGITYDPEVAEADAALALAASGQP